MLNINELIKSKENINLKKKELYTKILLRCHSQIKASSKFENYCIFKIPIYYPWDGHLYFNLEECLAFVSKQLSINGFEIYLFEKQRDMIYISWEKYVKNLDSNIEPLPQQIKCQKQEEVKKIYPKNENELDYDIDEIKRPNLNNEYFHKREKLEKKLRLNIDSKNKSNVKKEEKIKLIFK